MIPIPKHRRLILILMLTATFDITTPNRAVAAEPSTKSGLQEELRFLKEETVSIAARHEQPISEAPANVYVITDEDIRQSGATDLPTVLRRIPGLEVMQTTGTDFNVSVRGDNQLIANKLLVLVDGRSIYIDPSGTTFWKLLPVTLPEIKRIEVQKGPASAIYGFNAFDGVINIITKSPEEMKGTTLQFGGGELGTISSAAIHAGTQGKFGYRLSVGEDQNQQWRNRDALSFRAYKFNLHTEYALSADSKLSVSGGLVDSNRYDGPLTQVTISSDRPTQGYTYANYNSGNFSIRGWWFGTYTSGDAITLPLLASFIQTTDRNGSITDKTALNTYNVETEHALEFGQANRFSYGANYRHNTATSTFLAESTTEDRFGIYVQDEWHIWDPLTLVAGVRYDLDTFTDPTFSPRAALVYTPAEGHTFRAAVSVAYRSPTIDEINLDVRTRVTLPGPFTTTFLTVGSQNLQPEQITSYDVGYQGWYFKHRLRVRADLFFNHIAELITFLSSGPAVTDPVRPVNAGRADIYGGEVGIEFLATSWLSGFANYSYQEFDQTFEGFSRRGMPRQKFNIGLRGDWENGLNGEAALYHVGTATYPLSSAFTSFAPFFPPGTGVQSERLGSYNLLNLRAGYRFWKEKAEVAVSVFNALNDRHKEHPLGDTIGSRVMGWVTMRF